MAKFEYASPDAVQFFVPGDTTSLGLLAHHGDDDRLCANLVQYIRELAPNYQRFVLLTNERPLSNLADLPANCAVVYTPNQGLDFGKHMYLLHHSTHLTNLDRLGLFNDSVFIVAPLQPFFDAASGKGWEAWGMTGSAEIAPHIQSYFLATESRRATQQVLAFFQERSMDHVMSPTYTKMDLILEFEIGTSHHLAKVCTLSACFTMQHVLRVTEPRAAPPNVSGFYWDALMRLGCPLLKKQRWRLSGVEMPGLLPEYASTIGDIDAKVIDLRTAQHPSQQPVTQ